MPPKLKPHHSPALLAALTAAGAALALAGGAAWRDWPPAAFWHLVFAVGAMPMVFAAMTYFTPVLTRTPEAPRSLVAMSLVALLAALGIVGWFVRGSEALRLLSPWLGLATTLAFLQWIARRWRACLGRPHACLRWYAAALACLGLGLTAVGLSAIVPAWAGPLRAFHLHINTLGFLGLTAIGTLQVLLPTVLGQPDPAAARRLARALPWSAGGALAVAAGAGAWWPLAAIGALAYAWPLGRLLVDALRAFGPRLWQARQASPLLVAAMAGLMLVVFHGLLHGVGIGNARNALPLFLIGFLLPLVSGAVAQLLPVWLRPGAQAAWQKSQRWRLAALARFRAAVLFVGGLLAATGIEFALVFGILGALWLLVAMLDTAHRARPDPRLPTGER